MSALPAADPVTMPAALHPDVMIRPEHRDDDGAVDALGAAAFGPGRHARTAYRIREAGQHDAALSFVATTDGGGRLLGSVRMTAILIGAAPAWLLGPLTVAPDWSGRGIGRALVRRAVAAADLADGAPVLLVGDLPYYGPCGFQRVDPASVVMPGPVEPGRLLMRSGSASPTGAPPSGAVRAIGPA